MKKPSFFKLNIAQYVFILTILLLTISLVKQCNAQNKLTTSSNIEFGYEKFSEYVEYKFFELNDLAMYHSPWLYAGTLTFGIHYWKFSFENEVKSYFSNFSFDEFTFDVNFVRYETKLKFNYKDIEIGCSHHCFHPIYSNNTHILISYSDKFYIKLKIK